MDLINILTLCKSLSITYINSNIYILIDKCLLVSGYTLTTSSDGLHGTTWRCQSPFGGGSSTKILYVNGDLFFPFFPFSCTYNSCKYHYCPARA